MLYKLIPFSAFSGVAGWAEKQKIKSKLARKLLFGSFARVFGCNMDEATKPIDEFSSFGEFFSRPLKPGVRSFEKIDGIVSSTDGKVLHYGQVHFNDSGAVFPEQVKGSLYKLSDLIGAESAKSFPGDKGRSIYYCTVYLAPGDYHRFHSPANIKIESVESFSGEVLSVAPLMMKLVPHLLCINERKAINGKWKHGRISIVPVGAANVGSIIINGCIKPLQKISIGDEIGRFELGSTVVYILEAPSNFSWNISAGQSIKMGQPLLSAPIQKRSWFNWF